MLVRIPLCKIIQVGTVLQKLFFMVQLFWFFHNRLLISVECNKYINENCFKACDNLCNTGFVNFRAIMPIIRKEGKDTIIFATKEDHATPSKVTLPAPEPSPGLILPNGEINWNCPCLGGMATGPCGVEFREAFSCFHYSTADPKGSDCYEAFKTMQSCMSNYPALYANKETDLDELDNNESGELKNEPENRRDLKGDNVPQVRNESSQSVTSSKREVEPAKAQ